MKLRDLTGKRFGKLTVIKRSNEKSSRVKWECKCDCGNIITVYSNSLVSGRTKSCGCLKSEINHNIHFIDITGQKFGRWTALSLAPKRGRRTYWLCRCDCGTIKEVEVTNLRNGKTLSCGCFSAEIAKENNSKDLTGQRFGKLTVLKRIYGYDKVYWDCKCDCGNYTRVITSCLTGGHTKSCGCITLLKDISGQRFGKLLVKYRTGDKDGRTMWHCLCDCGKEVDVRRDSLLFGTKKSCGCILSNGEIMVRDILDKYRVSYQREYSFRDSEIPTYRYDFAIIDSNSNPVALIEYDGIQHYQPIAFGSDQSWETKVSNLAAISMRDLQKNWLALDKKLPLLRIKYDEKDIENTIITFLKSHNLLSNAVIDCVA